MGGFQQVVRSAVVDRGDYVHWALDEGMTPGMTDAALDRLIRLEGRRVRAGSLLPFRVLVEARGLKQVPEDLVLTFVRRQAEFRGRVVAFAGFTGALASVLRSLDATRHRPDVRFFATLDEAQAWLRSL